MPGRASCLEESCRDRCRTDDGGGRNPIAREGGQRPSVTWQKWGLEVQFGSGGGYSGSAGWGEVGMGGGDSRTLIYDRTHALAKPDFLSPCVSQRGSGNRILFSVCYVYSEDKFSFPSLGKARPGSGDSRRLAVGRHALRLLNGRHFITGAPDAAGIGVRRDTAGP